MPHRPMIRLAVGGGALGLLAVGGLTSAQADTVAELEPGQGAVIAGPQNGAGLGAALDVAVGADGTVYVADHANHRVRAVGADGEVSTVAGSGEDDFGGDGGPATEAALSSPTGVAVDAEDNLYIADRGNNRVRRVDGEDGTISTLAGSGEYWEFSDEDSEQADEAALNPPLDVAVDAEGAVYIVEEYRPGVRVVDSDGGIGALDGARHLQRPNDVAVDDDGGVYVVDHDTGQVYAGDGGADMEPLTPQVRGPISVAADDRGNVYVGTGAQHLAVWPAGESEPELRLLTSPLIGPGNATSTGHRVAIGPEGELYMAADGRVGVVDDPPSRWELGADGGATSPSGEDPLAELEPRTVRSVAGATGGAAPSDGAEATEVVLRDVSAISAGADGALYVAEQRNGFPHGALSVVRPDGDIEALTSEGELSGFFGGDPSDDALGGQVHDVVVAADGTSYAIVGDMVYRATPSGVVTWVAGGARLVAGGEDTVAADLSPRDLALNADGDLYILGEGGLHVVEGADGTMRTLTESISPGGGVAVGPDGEVYAVDDDRVVRIANGGGAEPVAGASAESSADDPVLEHPGDTASATEVSLSGINDLAADSEGNLYIATTSRAYLVDPDGELTWLAGDDDGVLLPVDGTPAADIRFESLTSLAVDSHGNLYLADTEYGLVHAIARPAALSLWHGPWPWVNITTVAVLLAAAGVVWFVRRRGVARTRPGGQAASSTTSGRDESEQTPAE